MKVLQAVFSPRRMVAIIVMLLCLLPAQLASAAEAFRSQAQITQALAEGAELKILPQLVVPLPRILSTEFANTHNCLIQPTTTSKNPISLWPGDAHCSFGDLRSKRVVVLLGDSHAAMFAGVFDALGKQHHYRTILLSFAGCQIASISQWNWQTHAAGTSCDVFRSQALRHIDQLKPFAVIVADNVLRVNRSSNYEPIKVSTYLAAEVRSLKGLGAPHRKVVLFGNTPNLRAVGSGVDPTACLSTHLTNVKACNIRRSEITKGLFPFEERAAKRSGASFIPFTDWFCTATTCPLVVSNTAVYLNPSHPSLHYLSLLQPLVDDKLATAGVR